MPLLNGRSACPLCGAAKKTTRARSPVAKGGRVLKTQKGGADQQKQQGSESVKTYKVTYNGGTAFIVKVSKSAARVHRANGEFIESFNYAKIWIGRNTDGTGVGNGILLKLAGEDYYINMGMEVLGFKPNAPIVDYKSYEVGNSNYQYAIDSHGDYYLMNEISSGRQPRMVVLPAESVALTAAEKTAYRAKWRSFNEIYPYAIYNDGDVRTRKKNYIIENICLFKWEEAHAHFVEHQEQPKQLAPAIRRLKTLTQPNIMLEAHRRNSFCRDSR